MILTDVELDVFWTKRVKDFKQLAILYYKPVTDVKNVKSLEGRHLWYL